MKNRIVKLLTNSDWSERKIANQVKTQKTIVHRIKIHNNIKTNKCEYIPKYTDNQLKRAKTNCRKLYRQSIGKKFIIDDESYIMADPKNIPGQKYFMSVIILHFALQNLAFETRPPLIMKRYL